MICKKCQSYMIAHPEAKFALFGWLKCSCGYCSKDLAVAEAAPHGEDEKQV